MNKLLQTFALLLVFQLGFAQNIYLAEHFDYPAGDSLQNNGWYAHSAGGTNPIRVHSSGLSWSQTAYQGSGVGNAAIVNNNGSDENRPLSSYLNSGDVYASFLLNVSGVVASNNAGYFFHMGDYQNNDQPVFTNTSSGFRARTHIAPGSSSAHYRLGLTFNANAVDANDFTADLDTGKTYLVVVKYTFVPGDTNDHVSLYLFNDGDDISVEPATPTIGPVFATLLGSGLPAPDMPIMQYVALRQYNLNPNIIVDGIIVKDGWDLLADDESADDLDIVNYWHFNSASGTLDTVHADYNNGGAFILYQQIDPSGDAIGFMDDVAGSDMNARAGYDAGRGIRPRNPSFNAELLFGLNSTGYENLKFSYALQRSGSGMLKQQLYISTDGVNFDPFGDTVLVTATSDFQLVEFDLSGLTAANDNPNLMAKIRFFEQNVASNGNNRFDNVVLEGKPVEASLNIVNYWHFNNTVGANLDTVPADYDNGGAFILFQQIDPNGAAIGRMDDVSGTDLNAKAGYDAGNGIRPRNPSDNAEILIGLNSEGFKDLKLSYATQTSSFNSGMLRQVLYISTDGVNFNQFGDTFVFATTDYELVEFDLSSLADANDNPNLMAKIRFFGNTAGTSGNNRFDNVVLEGVSTVSGIVPVESITVTPSDITFGIGDREQLNINVRPLNATNREFTIVSTNESVAIVNDDNEVIGISGGMAHIIVTSLDAGLADTVSVTVLERKNVTFNVSDEDGAALENALVQLGEFDLTTDANGSVDISVVPGTYALTVSSAGYLPFTNNEVAIVNDTTINIELAALASSLIHYWHFNNLIPGNVPDNVAAVDYTLLPNANPTISLGFLPEYTENTVDPAYLDDFTPGSALNAQRGEDEGAALRVRNRMEHRSLLIELPSTDVTELVLTFDVHRSGSGMLINHFDYSLDGGSTWSNEGVVPTSHTINENYETKTVDLSGITGANNNPDFVLRIIYEGNIAQSNGNNRYDNIALFGKTDIINVEKINALSNVKVYPNPAVNNFTVELSSNDLNNASYTLISTSGSVVAQNAINNVKTEINTTDLSKGVYILLVQQGASISQHKIIVQ